MKILKFLKRLPKKFYASLAIVVAAAAIATPIVVRATTPDTQWGPDRPTFDYANGTNLGSTTGPVFNSFINVPDYGDERNFTTVSSDNQANWVKSVDVTPGQTIQVRAYVHNNANSGLNGTNFDGISVAHNTRVRFYIPSGLGNAFNVAAYVSADNATPGRVYDTAIVQDNSQPVSLSYVPGSAIIYNNGPFKNGMPIPDCSAIINGANCLVSDNGSGAQIGYSALDGNLPGCFDFRETVIITLKVNAPALQFSKQVTTPGSTNWQPTMVAQQGDTTSWLLNYKDVGSAEMDNVVLRDTLPKDLTLVPGSITLFDSEFPNGHVLPDTALSDAGVNVGDYGPGGGGYIRFRATVNQNPSACTITNVAYAKADTIPEQSGQASVTVQNCNIQPKQPQFSCDLFDIKQNDRTITVSQFHETPMPSQGNVNGVVATDVVLGWGDNSAALKTDATNIFNTSHTYAANVTSATITAVADFTVNGQPASSGNSCTKTVSFTPPTTTLVSVVTPPTQLVNTGPGNIIGLFAGVTIAGAVLHRLFLSRKLARN